MNQSIYSFIPFVRTHMTTANLMFTTILALLPSAGYGMYLYGLHAALLLGICVITAVVAEALMGLVLQRGLTITDYSAIVTGLIGGMLLPANAPYYYAVILALIAIISKQAFGGIGQNILNPAGLGALLLFLVFRSVMTDYTGGEYGSVGALTLLASGEEMTLGNMLLGHVAGPIGTGSAVTILIGATALFLIGVTDIYIPLAYLASFSVFWVIAGGYGLSPYQLAVQIAGGSFLFTAFFMAQDNTTSPMSRKGKVIYGILLGLLTGILRRVGIRESAALIALILGNLTVRWLDTRTFPAIFGVDATVRRVRRDRRRRQEQPDAAQAAAASLSGYQQFEENVVPKGAMDGSETAGTINADSIESFHNRRAVTYDTASIDPAEVRRQLERQGHGMKQSMPIFGAPVSQGQETPASQPGSTSYPGASAQQGMAAMPNYSMPAYQNGQPMYDNQGNPLPLLDSAGNPVLDAYGNMIWGQPMMQAPQMPYGQTYAAPQYSAAQGMPAMPVYGQTQMSGMPSEHRAEQGAATRTDSAERGRRRKVSEEPVSRDTDFIEVAEILRAARAREQQGGGSALQGVQYMDLSSGFSSPEIRKAADRLEHKPAGRKSSSQTPSDSGSSGQKNHDKRHDN